MVTRVIYILFLISIILFIGYSIYNDKKRNDKLEKTDKIVEKLFLAIDHENVDSIRDCYSDIFYKKIKIGQWDKSLKKKEGVVGNYEGRKLFKVASEKKESGDEITILSYEITYSKKKTEEKFSFIKEEDGTYKIMDHNIMLVVAKDKLSKFE